MKNGQTTMPEGQITDGQTELQSKCQGLEEAVAELDNIIRKDCKTVRFSQCEPLSGKHKHFLIKMYVPASYIYCTWWNLEGWDFCIKLGQEGPVLKINLQWKFPQETLSICVIRMLMAGLTGCMHVLCGPLMTIIRTDQNLRQRHAISSKQAKLNTHTRSLLLFWNVAHQYFI